MGVEAPGPELVDELRALTDHYPTPRGALLPILTRLQEWRTFLADEDLVLAGEITGLSPAEVLSVSSFYTMYRRQKAGKFPLGVCRNIACWLCGSDDLIATIREELGIDPNETTADGMFSLQEVECLGSCGTAPALEIDGHYFEQLTPDGLRKLIADLKSGAVDPSAPRGEEAPA